MLPGRDPTFIDLFAGAGGISLGLINSGWKGIFAIEKNKMAFETLRFNLIDKHNYNWPEWLPIAEHDINDVLVKYLNEIKKLKGDIDLITGGPPCQGFSFAGRRKRTDERNTLVNAYVKFIKLVKPRFVFLENVKGFSIGFGKKNGRNKAYSDYVAQKLRSLGYTVKFRILNFSEYGVPQNRKRLILVGDLHGRPEVFFTLSVNNKARFLLKKGIRDFVTLEEAISDLKKEHGVVNSLKYNNFQEGVYGRQLSNYQTLMKNGWDSEYPDSHRFSNHREKTVERLNFILNNSPKGVDISNDLKKKFNLKKHTIIPLNGKDICATLTTLPDDYIHYSEPRILTVREYARVQSFPDKFEFKGKYTTGGKYRRIEVPRYSQVGNAVPPLYSELAGMAFKEMI